MVGLASGRVAVTRQAEVSQVVTPRVYAGRPAVVAARRLHLLVGPSAVLGAQARLATASPLEAYSAAASHRAARSADGSTFSTDRPTSPPLLRRAALLLARR